MKPTLWVAGLLLLLILLQGCIVVCMDDVGPCELTGVEPNEACSYEVGLASVSTFEHGEKQHI